MTKKQQGNIVAIIMMILLFGMISFVTNLAAPMGVVLKNQFGIPNSLGLLGNFMNFLAYAVMGIPSGKLLEKVGYKKTALLAILIGFIGVGIQYFSGVAASFYVYLFGAFIAGFSMCMLNTVVNPMLNTLGGGGKKGNTLIQIGGSFNSLMGTSVPLLVGVLVGTVSKASIPDVNPVLFIALGIFALVGIVLYLVNIPEPESTIDRTAKGEKSQYSPWSFRHFVLGAVAIFIYVGVEVGVPGTANLYMTSFTAEQANATVAEYNKQQSDAAYLAQLKDEDKANENATGYEPKVIKENTFESAQKIVDGKTKPGLGIATGIAGGVVGFYWLLMLIGRLTGAAIGSKISSKTMLIVASALGIILVAAAIFSPIESVIKMPAFDTSGGTLSVGMVKVPLTFLFLALVGICTSVMWGGIFNLAVEGLGKYVAKASGIFMMLVVGGGIIPLAQGWLADIIGFMPSYWLMFICIVYLLYYALVGSKNVNQDIPVK
ncbi:MAG: MFS transporter [Dysgonamonadaceae bacterium]|jgi:FHS family L-fucose permease-like MFS transporter|nr:MFS transporter [Dysgonamonadaceae bacterium]